MSNEELVIRIKAGDNTADNMLQLYQQVKAFIHSIAWKFRSYEETEDLEQEGYLALYDAVDGYDPDTGYKFLTYAKWIIQQRMQQYIMDKGTCLRLPGNKNERLHRYKKLCNAYLMKLGRKPTDWEAAYRLKLTTTQAAGIRELVTISNLGSLDAPVKGVDGGGDITVCDMVAAPDSPEEEITDRIYREQREKELWECVDSLKGKHPEVIRKRYQENQTLQQIANDYGISRQRAQALQAAALRELRKPTRSAKLRPYLDDIRSMSMSGTGVGRFQRTWTSSTEYAAIELLTRSENDKGESLRYIKQ